MKTATSHLSASSHGKARQTGPVAYLMLALSAWHQRRALAALPAERLDDLGLTVADAMREAGKPIWDVPGHWLK